ncbi:MAG TPA: glucosamine-6-phosphate deaminase [Clostridiales bacterium]|nr:glucosamine-6-phosphate deaminase [Clostridiales bacterium]
MQVKVLKTAQELGQAAAGQAAIILNQALEHQETARLVLSTGQSQFETLAALIQQPVDWSRVELFHLDEYVGLPVSHPASFRKYLLERFISQVSLKTVNLVDGEGDAAANIRQLNAVIRQAPADLGLIGIGENAHIAFNDPPADFMTEEPYIVVNLSDTCKNQQVREGWFPDPASVPAQAISMSVRHILKCRAIISSVPHAVKADAVLLTLASPVSEQVPASILRTHPAASLFLDQNSAAGLSADLLERFR